MRHLGNSSFRGLRVSDAIAPVVSAIRVLERMNPDGHLLFDRLAHDLRKARPGAGSLKPSALSDRIEDYTAWADTEAAARQLSGETIPPAAPGLQRGHVI